MTKNMIQIIYTGTSDKEMLLPENNQELETIILNRITQAFNSSKMQVIAIHHCEADSLPNEADRINVHVLSNHEADSETITN